MTTEQSIRAIVNDLLFQVPNTTAQEEEAVAALLRLMERSVGCEDEVSDSSRKGMGNLSPTDKPPDTGVAIERQIGAVEESLHFHRNSGSCPLGLEVDAALATLRWVQSIQGKEAK